MFRPCASMKVQPNAELTHSIDVRLRSATSLQSNWWRRPLCSIQSWEIRVNARLRAVERTSIAA